MMNNKIRKIDINIVSAYMGRLLPVIVMLMVLAITLSAVVGVGGLRDHVILVVGVPQNGGTGSAQERYAPLRQLLARETGRTVSLSPRGTDWNDGCDLYLLETGEFVKEREKRGLVAVYSFSRMQRRSDAAILVSRRGSQPPAFPGRDDVIFADPRSINGCWVQLAFLDSTGFETPERIEDLRFAPPPGGSRSWPVFIRSSTPISLRRRCARPATGPSAGRCG